MQGRKGKHSKKSKPPQPEDLPIVTECAEVLKKAGFKGKLSLECSFGSDFDKAITDVYPLLDCFRKIQFADEKTNL